MLWYLIIILVGLKYRNQAYWLRAIVIPIYVFLIDFLFRGGGTLERPELDGLVTRLMRSHYNDGPEMGFFAIGVILLLWAPTIWWFILAIKKGKESLSASHAINK